MIDRVAFWQAIVLTKGMNEKGKRQVLINASVRRESFAFYFVAPKCGVD